MGPVPKGTISFCLCHPGKLIQFQVYLRIHVYTYEFDIPVWTRRNIASIFTAKFLRDSVQVVPANMGNLLNLCSVKEYLKHYLLSNCTPIPWSWFCIWWYSAGIHSTQINWFSRRVESVQVWNVIWIFRLFKIDLCITCAVYTKFL